MRLFRLRRFCVVFIVTFLAACAGGAGPVPTVVSEAPLKRDPASADLIYASATDGVHIYILSYPDAKLVRKFAAPAGTISLQGLCSDATGNVYITSVMKSSGTGNPVGRVYEYAHGGTKILKTLTFDNEAPFGCSVDPKSKTLAISTSGVASRNGEVWTFASGSYYGKQYATSDTQNYRYCAYDGKSDLFVNGQGYGTQMYLNEIKSGASQMSELTLDKYVSVSGMGQLQWDGTHMTLEHLTAGVIDQLSVSGSHVKVAGKSPLFGWTGTALSTIVGRTVIVPTGVSQTSIGVWKYPSGGKPLKMLSSPGGLVALTISVGSQR